MYGLAPPSTHFPSQTLRRHPRSFLLTPDIRSPLLRPVTSAPWTPPIPLPLCLPPPSAAFDMADHAFLLEAISSLSLQDTPAPGSLPFSAHKLNPPAGPPPRVSKLESPRHCLLELLLSVDPIQSCGFKFGRLDFPGVTVVKNPPANAGDTGSSPGPGRCRGATKTMRHNC